MLLWLRHHWGVGVFQLHCKLRGPPPLCRWSWAEMSLCSCDCSLDPEGPSVRGVHISMTQTPRREGQRLCWAVGSPRSFRGGCFQLRHHGNIGSGMVPMGSQQQKPSLHLGLCPAGAACLRRSVGKPHSSRLRTAALVPHGWHHCRELGGRVYVTAHTLLRPALPGAQDGGFPSCKRGVNWTSWSPSGCLPCLEHGNASQWLPCAHTSAFEMQT